MTVGLFNLNVVNIEKRTYCSWIYNMIMCQSIMMLTVLTVSKSLTNTSDELLLDAVTSSSTLQMNFDADDQVEHLA